MGNNPAPAPSLVSHCSRGGSQVLAADDEGTGNRDARGEGMMREWGTMTQGVKGRGGNGEQGHKGDRDRDGDNNDDDNDEGDRDGDGVTAMRGTGTRMGTTTTTGT